MAKLFEDARRNAAAGPEMKRLVALVQLVNAESNSTAEVAAAVFADESAPLALRRDALQIVLLIKGQPAGNAAAVTALTNPDAGVRRLAVQFLSIGPGSLSQLRDRHIYLSSRHAYSGRSGQRENYIPKVPAGLDRDVLRALLRDQDPAVAAGAGYLLALLDDPAGLPALVRHCRENARDDREWIRLAAMAVSCLDDGSRVPVLEELYRELNPVGGDRRDDSAVRDLYRTMRPMTGPNALRLRSTFRAEVGMSVIGTLQDSTGIRPGLR